MTRRTGPDAGLAVPDYGRAAPCSVIMYVSGTTAGEVSDGQGLWVDRTTHLAGGFHCECHSGDRRRVLVARLTFRGRVTGS